MSAKAWAGVFNQATDRRVEQFSESISFDQRLYAHDITASIAHAQMLAQVGLLTPTECQEIEQALQTIRQDIEQGRFEFKTELEDIHLHIERALIERVGDVGRKLHTARSRNDQVSTDLRLWCRDAVDEIDRRLIDLRLMTPGEIAWLHAYHARIAPAVDRLLDAAERRWLSKSTAPLAK